MTDSHTDVADTGDCPDSEDGSHSPDWRTVQVSSDGELTYIDVSCEYCGASGCVGTNLTLAADIAW